MPKKKRGRKQPAWKKWVRMGLGIAGTAIGGVVAFSPTFNGIQTMVQGNPVGGANLVVHDLTGMNPIDGNYTPDITRLIGTGIVVGVGVGIMSLFRYFARRV